MSELAIRAEGLSKRYVRGAEPRGKLIEWLRRRVRKDYFWALDDVTFDVKKGEMLGIIGLNGAGKSTLLKLLSRTPSVAVRTTITTITTITPGSSRRMASS